MKYVLLHSILLISSPGGYIPGPFGPIPADCLCRLCHSRNRFVYIARDETLSYLLFIPIFETRMCECVDTVLQLGDPSFENQLLLFKNQISFYNFFAL